MEIPTAIFVCQHCKKLCIIDSQIFTTPSSETQKTQRSNPIHSSQTLCVHTKDYYQWIYKDEFSNLKEEFRDFIEFPLCNNCRQFYDHFSQKSTFYKRQTAYLNEKLSKDILPMVQNLKEDIQLTQSKSIVLEEVVKSSTTDINRLLNSVKVPQIVPAQQSYTEQPKKDEADPGTNYQGFIRSTDGLSSLMLCTTFCIMGYNHCGTINGCRLAFSLSNPIPNEEISSALLFLCHMLFYSGTKMKTDLCGLVLEPLSFSGVPFNPADLKKKSAIESFNFCMKSLMKACFSLFECIGNYMKNFAPPYPILLSQNMIERECYLYQASKPYIWTAAMKLLLFDFKVLQKCCLQLGKYILNPQSIDN